MEELKGIEQVNNVVNNFVSQFNLESEMGTDFSYFYPINKITWSYLMTEKSNKSFEKFLEDNFPDIDCNLFVWSLLHEIGHHETMEMWEDKEQQKFDKQKEELENRLLTEDEYAVCMEYYKIPDEFEATSWAADYLRENLQEVKSFYEEFRKESYKFAELNGVDIDGV